MWPLLAIAGVGALTNYAQAKEQQEQQRRQNLAAAAQTQYSPWTHMGAGQINTSAQDPGLAALQGGMSGAMTGYMLGQGMKNTDKSNALAKIEYQKNFKDLNSRMPTDEEMKMWEK